MPDSSDLRAMLRPSETILQKYYFELSLVGDTLQVINSGNFDLDLIFDDIVCKDDNDNYYIKELTELHCICATDSITNDIKLKLTRSNADGSITEAIIPLFFYPDNRADSRLFVLLDDNGLDEFVLISKSYDKSQRPDLYLALDTYPQGDLVFRMNYEVRGNDIMLFWREDLQLPTCYYDSEGLGYNQKITIRTPVLPTVDGGIYLLVHTLIGTEDIIPIRTMNGVLLAKNFTEPATIDLLYDGVYNGRVCYVDTITPPTIDSVDGSVKVEYNSATNGYNLEVDTDGIDVEIISSDDTVSISLIYIYDDVTGAIIGVRPNGFDLSGDGRGSKVRCYNRRYD